MHAVGSHYATLDYYYIFLDKKLIRGGEGERPVEELGTSKERFQETEENLNYSNLFNHSPILESTVIGTLPTGTCI